MRRTIAAVSATLVAGLGVASTPPAGVRAASPQTAAATAALRYLYSQQGPDGSIAGSPGPTEDTIIAAADGGYDPGSLVSSNGVPAFAYLASQVSAGKVNTAGKTAKLILAWVAAGRPGAIDGAALIARLNGAPGSGGFMQPNGSFHASDANVETANAFSQGLAVLADVAAGQTLPANATGWLVCAQRPDGGFGFSIDAGQATPPAFCGDTFGSDTNDTAIAIEALNAARVGTANAKAVMYLGGAQQADGGFGFDASSSTDPDSDAVVIQALVSMGQDPSGSAWTKSGKTPLSSLAGFETPPGSGAYLFPGSKAPDAFTTSQVPAALELSPYGSTTAFPPGRSPRQGYWLVAADGGIFPFGSAVGLGSTGNVALNKPIVGMATTLTQNGYWLVASDGGLFPFGDAVQHSYGSTGNVVLNKPIVGMARTASGNGYWLVASDGGIFPFGDAVQHSYGSTGGMRLNMPIVGTARTASGNGYWLVASDGGIFPFGDAVQHSYGSTGGMRLNMPIVGMARTASGNGYWLVASDGGIFPFGDAVQHSFGSTGNVRLNAPIVGMAPTDGGNGYWLVASDGGIFPFGDAVQHSYGSTGGIQLNKPILGMAPTADGNGYWLVASDGGIFPFGPSAAGLGSTGSVRLNKPIVGMAGLG
jgi:hypothetical protein